MAYAKSTFNDILQALSYRYGETVVPTSGIDNRKYWVNRGIEFCIEELNMQKSASVVVASGVCPLNVATTDPVPDFKSVVVLRDSSNQPPYKLCRPDEYAIKVGNYYAITGNHSDGFVLNAKHDGVFELHYYFYTSPLSATTDVSVIPDPEAVAAYAYAMLRKSETDPLEDADKNMEECRERIGKMAENIARNEGDLTFKTMF